MANYSIRDVRAIPEGCALEVRNITPREVITLRQIVYRESAVTGIDYRTSYDTTAQTLTITRPRTYQTAE